MRTWVECTTLNIELVGEYKLIVQPIEACSRSCGLWCIRIDELGHSE
jgi:hypothetical protein